MRGSTFAMAVWGTLLMGLVRAQEVGTIAGVVRDAESRDPLSFANVVVVNTQLGAAANEDGAFLITGVPTGTYQIRATRIGYAEGTLSVVVEPGHLASVEFALQVLVLQGEELAITADRPYSTASSRSNVSTRCTLASQ